MRKALSRLVFLIVFVMVATYGYFTLRSPQGIPALREKWTEIRKMEEDNAALQSENDYRRKRIEKLQNNPAEQELEIRKKLKLLRPGETSFILPDQPKPAASAPPRGDSKAPPPLQDQD